MGAPSGTVVRVDLVNGRRLWLLEVVDDDDRWLRGTNSRGRSVLLAGDRLKRVDRTNCRVPSLCRPPRRHLQALASVGAVARLAPLDRWY